MNPMITLTTTAPRSNAEQLDQAVKKERDGRINQTLTNGDSLDFLYGHRA